VGFGAGLDESAKISSPTGFEPQTVQPRSGPCNNWNQPISQSLPKLTHVSTTTVIIIIIIIIIIW
jgi:hypothetical protein